VIRPPNKEDVVTAHEQLDLLSQINKPPIFHTSLTMVFLVFFYWQGFNFLSSFVSGWMLALSFSLWVKFIEDRSTIIKCRNALDSQQQDKLKELYPE
jgi:hypothetical protein